ncbi:hypothetical protein F110043I8_33810 [Ruminococcus sp. f11]
MKAAVVVANEDVQYQEIEEPKVTKGTVKIRVRYSGICGSDIPRVLNHGVHFYPIVLGHEFSGDVVEVGEGVTKVKVGDRVSGAPLLPCMKCDDCQQGNFSLCKHYSFIGSRQQGSNADYVVVPEQNAVPFESSVPYEQGAMFEPATVAIHGVFQNDYHGGEYVAILGGGTVGMFTMQWTKIFGSKKVVVFDISEERLELAKRLGADEVINTRDEGYMEKAMAITGGKGYGFVFETAGQVPTMHMAFELAANKAHVCFIGTPHENLTFTPAQWENMNRKEFKLTGSWMSYSAPYPGREWDLTAHYFATGQLKFDPGFIYKKIPMSQAQEAFQLFKTPGLVKGKILLSNEEEVVDPKVVPKVTLPSGEKVPCMGMGTFGSDRVSAEEVSEAVAGAIRSGYRMFDCAACYGNEHQIGEVFKAAFDEGVVERKDLFIMTKVWNDMHRKVEEACTRSIQDLQCDYVDLYFIHWPFPNYHAPFCDVDSRNPESRPFSVEEFMDTYRQCEKLVEKGKIRYIGISNMTIPKLEAVLPLMKIKPAACELELHPCFQQQEQYDYLIDHNIQPVGYMPLGSPRRPERDICPEDVADMQTPEMQEIAKAHGVHPALIALKWAHQRGEISIPFSVHNYVSNLKCVTEDPLTDEEMAKIATLEKGNRLVKGQVFLWEGAKDWHDLWDEDGVIVK